MKRDVASSFLARKLIMGEINLFLGAGASVDLGLPVWKDYVNMIRIDVGLEEISESLNSGTPEQLQLSANEVFTKINKDLPKYKQVLKKCLYTNMPDLSVSVLKNDLLLSIGALLMGSKRGSIKKVITLNHDSLLEWYLMLYGFIIKTIADFPYLEGSADVTIFHPHGYLPHPSLNLHDSNEIILSLDSVNRRISKGHPWYELMRHMFRTGICLFVGMSENTFNDRAIGSLLGSVGDELTGIEPGCWIRPTGFWILIGEPIPQVQDNFLNNNIVPLYLASKEEVPKFLFEVCQKASTKALLRNMFVL